ncbi:MAG: hypothetical protein ACTHLU_09060 [Novosphingobium sp.]
MPRISDLKGGGYLVSTASVVLLAIPAFKSAAEDGWMLAALIAGMVLSVSGMALRWRSHRLDQKQRDGG